MWGVGARVGGGGGGGRGAVNVGKGRRAGVHDSLMTEGVAQCDLPEYHKALGACSLSPALMHIEVGTHVICVWCSTCGYVHEKPHRYNNTYYYAGW